MVRRRRSSATRVVRAGIGCDDARDRRSARIPSRQHTGHTGHPPALTEVLPWSGHTGAWTVASIGRSDMRNSRRGKRVKCLGLVLLSRHVILPLGTSSLQPGCAGRSRQCDFPRIFGNSQMCHFLGRAKCKHRSVIRSYHTWVPQKQLSVVVPRVRVRVQVHFRCR